jgi:hypothetical protein
MKKKLAGILPKNAESNKTEAYESPKERRSVSIEEADDGTFSIRCRGDGTSKSYDYNGALKTAESVDSMLDKVREHFGSKSKKKD